MLLNCYQVCLKSSKDLFSNLKFISFSGGKFLFRSPNQYIFPGAEVYDLNDDSTSSTRSTLDDSSDDDIDDEEVAGAPLASTDPNSTEEKPIADPNDKDTPHV